jgi:GH25 family lysozyme M1 (1,4-beta-N-acetylmuramidase)
VLDFEKEFLPAQINMILDNINTWLTIVESHLGKKAIICTSIHYWRDELQGAKKFADHPLWVASYGADDPTHPNNNPPAMFGAWTDWAIWQYSSKGTVRGIVDHRGRPLPVDMNRYNLNANLLTS